MLTGYESDIYYTIDHCNYDWRKSKLLKSEYLQGFDDVKIGTYYRSIIYGNKLNEIPVKLERKIALERRINKGPLRYGFTLEKLDIDEYLF